ncbi:flagellar hook-length control protein FliK [Bacillaceae bacterium IKA-2]|jgi:flagellar hook-length control protein FliK|nr:flagellar hook-length control protein FliK [Bacillaceae bacterium IKA-2]
MNGISFMQMIQSQPVTQGGISVASDSTNHQATFFQMFNASLAEKNLEVSDLLKERENKAPLDDLFSGNEELVDLEKLMSQLIDALSGRDVIFAEDVLENPLVVDFLEQLSYDLQLELQALLGGNYSLKSLLEQGGGELNNPIQLLAVMIDLAHTQTQNQVDSETKIDFNFQTQLEKLLTMLSKNEQNYLSNEKINVRDFQEIVKQLTTSLQSMTTKERQQLTEGFEAQKKSEKEAQFVLSAFSRSVVDQSAKVNQGIVLPPAQGQLNSVQQFIIHVGENRGNQPTHEQFLRQFQNILGRSSLAQFPNGVNQLTIKLYPEHLGRLDVKLTQQNGVIIAQLMTTTNAARSAIESQLHQLRQAFIAQNISVEKIEISTQQQQQSLGQSDKENQEEKNHNKSNQEQSQNQDNEDEAINFEDFLESFNVKV